LRGNVLGALGNSKNHSRVLLREEPLRNRQKQRERQQYGEDHDCQRQAAVMQRDHQCAIVNPDQPVKALLDGL
jgi:hypothetical protein